jgi:hypothetical protein
MDIERDTSQPPETSVEESFWSIEKTLPKPRNKVNILEALEKNAEEWDNSDLLVLKIKELELGEPPASRRDTCLDMRE